MLTPEELTYHLKACEGNNRESQKIIYNSFYGYAMAICDRYTNSQENALEILNDGFLKVFKEVIKYKPAYADVVSSFKGWLRKIMVYTAIDYYRKEQKHGLVTQLDSIVYQIPIASEDAISKLSYEEIIKSILRLSPGYRIVFNLFIIEGLSHEEVATALGISVGTSKSNLSKARVQLQNILFKQNQIQVEKNAV